MINHEILARLGYHLGFTGKTIGFIRIIGTIFARMRKRIPNHNLQMFNFSLCFGFANPAHESTHIPQIAGYRGESLRFGFGGMVVGILVGGCSGYGMYIPIGCGL